MLSSFPHAILTFVLGPKPTIKHAAVEPSPGAGLTDLARIVAAIEPGAGVLNFGLMLHRPSAERFHRQP